MSEITGVGFYESLNKFFVGFLILVLFVGLKSDLFTEPLFLISAYIVGCIYQAIIQVFTKSCLSLQKTDIEKAYNEVHKNEKDNPSKVKEDYLKAYYKIAKAGLLMNIPVLEALENFMRNLIFIIPFYFIFFIPYENCNVIFGKTYPLFKELCPILKDDQNINCVYRILLIVFLVCIFEGVIWLRCYYQQTIYRLVWEGTKFLDEIDQDSKLEERKIRREMLKNRHFFFFLCKTRL
ncbi:hypothetical protein [Hoylesella nanceiensis]|uniref:hypothetical protein n=1 Tax=Hoylesella nanceiensis TaxID=425941 RepID=UPI00288A1806|nr:hypothetical protein [Hoylesella nanceiensis]